MSFIASVTGSCKLVVMTRADTKDEVEVMQSGKFDVTAVARKENAHMRET